VHIVPDEKGQYHSLSITAGDRAGLLYAIALVLSRYGVSCTPPRSPPSASAPRTFSSCPGPRRQSETVLQLETELLKALQA